MPTSSVIRYRVIYDAVIHHPRDGDCYLTNGGIVVDAIADLSGVELWGCVADYLWTARQCKAKQISILYVGEERSESAS